MGSLFKYVLSAAVAAFCCTTLGAQQRMRIPGLENNTEYARLAGEEETLSHRCDSLTAVMNDIRRSFRTDTLRRAANTEVLLRMENEMFDIRNSMARFAGQINAIEQEWILSNLDGNGTTPAAAPGKKVAGSGNTSANLVYSSYFRENLPPETYAELLRAQQFEPQILPLVERYAAGNRRLAELAGAYDNAASAETVAGIKAQFDSIAALNRSAERQISRMWETIFDSKSYSYNLLMDKDDRGDLMRRFGEDMDNLRHEEAAYRGRFASDGITAFLLGKRMLTKYEILLAEALSMGTAADSLGKVQRSLQLPENMAMEPVELRERLFIEYSDIQRESSPAYNQGNPIPEVEIYPKGIIYRIQLGTFSAPQPPSAFRNISPLAVQKGPDGKFRYFAGGFRDEEAVKKGVEQMSRTGFRQPHAVVWMDGVYVNLTTGASLGSGLFRIELSGSDELSPEVREAIRKAGGGKEILRGDGMFIVGPFDSAPEAAGLRLALDGAGGGLEIKISEIHE